MDTASNSASSFLLSIDTVKTLRRYSGDSITLEVKYEDWNVDNPNLVDSAFYQKYLKNRKEFCAYVGLNPKGTTYCRQHYFGMISRPNGNLKDVLILQTWNPLAELFLLRFNENQQLADVFQVASILGDGYKESIRRSILLSNDNLTLYTVKWSTADMIIYLDSNKYQICSDSISENYRWLNSKYVSTAVKDSVRSCKWVAN